MLEVFDLPAIFLITILLALAFDFVNGFHDAANAIATVVATRVLPAGAAVLMAGFFNLIGPLVVGVAVAKAVGSGIVEANIVQSGGIALVFAALVGAIVWDLLTWWWGLPTSSSHALIGGLVGAALAVDMHANSIVWLSHGPGGWTDHPKGVLIIIIFMVIAPILGFIGTYLFAAINARAFYKANAVRANWWYRKLQLISAAFYSFTHGANDAQKVMGVITMLLVTAITAGHATEQDLGVLVSDPVPPLWVIVSCALALGVGTAAGGWRIVKTMASRLTKLHPFEGFCAETGSALVLLGTAHFGIPVSTTHVISGGIMGVGATASARGVRWGMARRIFWAWIFTIPASALVAYATYFVVRLVM